MSGSINLVAKHDSAVPWPHAGLAEPNPFYEQMLLLPALTHLRAQLVHVLEPELAGRPVARLPVVATAWHGRFPVAHCTNWMHRHCFYGAPLLVQDSPEAGWEALLSALDSAPWSGLFLHLRGVDAEGPCIQALAAVCARQGRRLDEIGRYSRALLHSNLDASSYWDANVRAKKRKELRRLQARLADEGPVHTRALSDPADLQDWLAIFLAVERSGWKGERGTALGSSPADSAFLAEACTTAMAAGMLDMLRIDCGERTIAMLINFVGPGGSFSFKIAIDPAFARFSPGVLIEQANLARVLDDHVAPWMDSCASPDHPMIDSLWGERRTIAQYRVGLFKGGIGSLSGRIALPTLLAMEKGLKMLRRRIRS